MAQIKKIGMAVGTFSVALGIGFIMQNGDALASRFGGEDTDAPFVKNETPIAVAQAGLTAGTEQHGASPSLLTPDLAANVAVVLPEAARAPETPPAPVQLASVDPEALPEIDLPALAALDAAIPDATEQSAEIDCVPIMTGRLGPAAILEVNVAAPCHTDTAFTIHHQGMMFTATTDKTGNSDLTVPALAETAVVIAAFEHGDGAVATIAVPEFANYDRAVLQWQGDTAVMLSAYENGANFESDNHIFLENPGSRARVESGEGGYLLSLGDRNIENALIAEVYTYPTTMMTVGGNVTLVAEAEITADNCGHELNAQSIQIDPTGDRSALDLTMVMPDCDAVGDFLILQNMFQDLTLASR